MNEKLKNKVNELMRKTKANLLSSKLLYHGNFINLIEESYMLPNNVVIKRERIIKNNNKQAVIIIAITNDDKYILVSQNRINGLNTLELLEETGYTSLMNFLLKN